MKATKQYSGRTVSVKENYFHLCCGKCGSPHHLKSGSKMYNQMQALQW